MDLLLEGQDRGEAELSELCCGVCKKSGSWCGFQSMFMLTMVCMKLLSSDDVLRFEVWEKLMLPLSALALAGAGATLGMVYMAS